MSSAFAALRSLLYRPWLLATLAATASATLLLLASMGVAMHQLQESERAQMNAKGERFLERLEQIFGQLREGVDALQAQPLRGCDAQMMAALQQVTFDNRFVFEATYLDGEQSCSNRLGSSTFDPLRAPDIQGPTYSYWLNTTTEPDDNRAALVLGRGHFRVSTSRGHLTDVVDLPPGGSLLVVLDKGARAVPVLGPAQPWPPTEHWPPASRMDLTELPDRLAAAGLKFTKSAPRRLDDHHHAIWNHGRVHPRPTRRFIGALIAPVSAQCLQ